MQSCKCLFESSVLRVGRIFEAFYVKKKNKAAEMVVRLHKGFQSTPSSNLLEQVSIEDCANLYLHITVRRLYTLTYITMDNQQQFLIMFSVLQWHVFSFKCVCLVVSSVFPPLCFIDQVFFLRPLIMKETHTKC